jgi:hypothetical protein
MLRATDNVIISKTEQTSTNLRSSALISLHQRLKIKKNTPQKCKLLNPSTAPYSSPTWKNPNTFTAPY